jgi:hypothetical protein
LNSFVGRMFDHELNWRDFSDFWTLSSSPNNVASVINSTSDETQWALSRRNRERPQFDDE